MEKLLRNIYEDKVKQKICLAASAVSAWCAALFFGLQLFWHLILGEYITLAIVSASAAIGFILVTVLRKIINAKRPYEIYDFYTIPPRAKLGASHPSRHCYSAAVIATLGWLVSPLVTLAVGILALIIAVTRVVTGIHFVRDTAAGISFGVLFGGIGVLVNFLI